MYKSYFARRLARAIGGVRLNGDGVRLAIFGSLRAIDKVYHSPDRQHLNTYTFGAIDYVVEQLLEARIPVVYDAIHSKRMDREKQESIATRFNAIPVLVCMQTSFETALQRGQEREATSDDRQFSEEKMREGIAQFEQSMEPVSNDEHLITISGEVTFEEQLASFQKQLAEIMRRL